MRKTKAILAGFAIVASILMLSTTCIAAPVQQSISSDAGVTTVNYKLAVKDALTKNLYLKSAMQQMLNDPELLSAVGELLKVLKEVQIINTGTEDFLVPDAIELPGLPTNNYYPSGDGFDSTVSSGMLTQMGVIQPDGSAEALFSGFICNMNGQMYVPGLGWVSQQEYAWLNDALRGQPVSVVNAVLDQLSVLGTTGFILELIEFIILCFITIVKVIGAALYAIGQALVYGVVLTFYTIGYGVAWLTYLLAYANWILSGRIGPEPQPPVWNPPMP